MTSESTVVEETKWPESCPSSQDDHFFSVSCGNSWLHWSFHSGMDKGAQPVLFWRTPLINTEVIDAGDIVESLAEHLPKVEPDHATNGCSYYPRDHIFGKDNPPSSQAAINEAKSRETKTSVYIVSSNTDQVGMLSKLFQSIPSRVFQMKGDDFFSISDGRYDDIGLDRLAAVSGAAHLHGFPALVFDSGTAATYTAADSEGSIIGGGISPGFSMRFQSLSDGTHNLPHIKLEKFLEELQKKSNEKNHFPLFARSTKDSIIMGALSEMSNNARCVIRQWLEQVGLPTHNKNKITASFPKPLKNTRRSVLVTGGGAAVMELLLQDDCGGVIEPSQPGKEGKVKVMQVNNLIHFGITHALIRHANNADDAGSLMNSSNPSRKRSRGGIDDDSDGRIGVRVCKYFDLELFTGTITEYLPTGLYHVVYDDGDEEDFDTVEFNSAKKLYVKEMKDKANRAK